MKRKLLSFVLAAFVSVISFTSCSKNADKPDKPGGNSTKDKLVGYYKLTALTLEHEGGTENLLPYMSSCNRDNLYVLKADMTTAVVDAGEQCSPPSDDTGTWSLPNDNTIVMDGETYEIESTDGRTLKMSAEYSEDGVEGTVNMTYVKQ